jgi:hypothetical protein
MNRLAWSATCWKSRHVALDAVGERTPVLIAGALLDNVMEKIVWNQRERHRTLGSLGQV